MGTSDQNKDDLQILKKSLRYKDYSHEEVVYTIYNSDITLMPRFRYNTNDHPIPFHKAQDLGKVSQRSLEVVQAYIEDAYD